MVQTLLSCDPKLLDLKPNFLIPKGIVMVGLSTPRFVFMFKLDHRCEKLRKYKRATQKGLLLLKHSLLFCELTNIC